MIADGWLGRFQRRSARAQSRGGLQRRPARAQSPGGLQERSARAQSRGGLQERPARAQSRGGLRRRPARGKSRARFVRRPRPRAIVCLVVVLLVLGGGWLWVRDCSLVAVKRVSISGATGPDAGRIRAALRSAARSMTTLDVRMDQLRSAVAPYPVVRDLRVSTSFPHGIRIRVIEHDPVGAVVVGGREIAVAGDGTLLNDSPVAGSLPQIPLRIAPGGRRLTDHDALAAVALLSAAPPQWLSRLSQVITVSTHGLVAQIRGGPSIYFGDTARLAAKWAAAAVVLGDPGSAGALYIDVTDPVRPAAGPGSDWSSSSSAAASSGTSLVPPASTGASPAAAASTGASSSPAAGVSGAGAATTTTPVGG